MSELCTLRTQTEHLAGKEQICLTHLPSSPVISYTLSIGSVLMEV